jgi:Glycosyl transferase family 2
VRTLVAIPVYNEAAHVRKVVSRVLDYVGNVLIVDDGSSDRTPDIVREFPVDVIRHAVNRGYGRSVADAFRWAAADGYDWIITMDCDEQHEPDRIPDFLRAQETFGADIISGSRYMSFDRGDSTGRGSMDDRDGRSRSPSAGSNEPWSPIEASSPAVPQSARPSMLPPPDRRRINQIITAELNERFAGSLGTRLTDGFCGFKSHRVSRIASMNLTEGGYAFPMQLWTQAAALGMRVREIPVELIYNDPNRSFGGSLDDPEIRLRHYRQVMMREIHRWRDRLPASAVLGGALGCGCQ